MTDTPKATYIRHVSPELKRRLIADADEQASNMNDVCTSILAGRYEVDVARDATRKTAPSPSVNDVIMLRLPSGLRRALEYAAVATGRSASREAHYALCQHYGLSLPPLPGRNDPARVVA